MSLTKVAFGFGRLTGTFESNAGSMLSGLKKYQLGNKLLDASKKAKGLAKYKGENAGWAIKEFERRGAKLRSQGLAEAKPYRDAYKTLFENPLLMMRTTI